MIFLNPIFFYNPFSNYTVNSKFTLPSLIFFKSFTLSGNKVTLLPPKTVYKNLKNFFKIIDLFIERGQNIFAIQQNKFYVLYKKANSGLIRRSDLNIIIFLGNVPNKYVYKYSNFKSVVIFKGFESREEYALNIYPILLDLTNELNSYVYLHFLKNFIKDRFVFIKYKNLSFFYKNIHFYRKNVLYVC